MKILQAEWYPELLYMLIHLVSFLSISIGISWRVIYACLNVISKKGVIFFAIGKTLFVTLGVNFILHYFFHTNEVYWVSYIIVCIAASILTLVFLKIYTQDSYAKIVMACYVGDYSAGFALACTIIIWKILTGDMLTEQMGKKPNLEIVWCLFIAIILQFIITILEQKFHILKRVRKYKIKKPRIWLGLCILSICTAVASAVKGPLISKNLLYPVYLLLIVAGIAGIILYIVLQKIRRRNLYLENQNLLLQRNLLTEYYAALEEQMKLTRKMRHDILNHLQTIEMFAKFTNGNEEVKEYIISLKNSSKQIERINYSKDLLIDSVIFNKVKNCKENGIETIIDVSHFNKGNIPEIEMLSILYNLFDNAIEACQKVTREKERFIELYGGNIAGHIVLKMRNSMESIVIKDGKPITSKNDKAIHGIGLSIIEDFAKKRNGSVTITTEKQLFEIVITMENNITSN